VWPTDRFGGGGGSCTRVSLHPSPGIARRRLGRSYSPPFSRHFLSSVRALLYVPPSSAAATTSPTMSSSGSIVGRRNSLISPQTNSSRAPQEIQNKSSSAATEPPQRGQPFIVHKGGAALRPHRLIQRARLRAAEPAPRSPARRRLDEDGETIPPTPTWPPRLGAVSSTPEGPPSGGFPRASTPWSRTFVLLYTRVCPLSIALRQTDKEYL